MRGGVACCLGRLVAAYRVLLLGLRLHRRARMGKGREGNGEQPGRRIMGRGPAWRRGLGLVRGLGARDRRGETRRALDGRRWSRGGQAALQRHHGCN